MSLEKSENENLKEEKTDLLAEVEQCNIFLKKHVQNIANIKEEYESLKLEDRGHQSKINS